jgi:hypothetical protein
MTKQDETLRIVRNMHGGNAHDDNCPACREIKAREAEGVPMIPPSERPEPALWCETCRDVHGPSGPHVGELPLSPDKAELLREIDRQHVAESAAEDRAEVVASERPENPEEDRIKPFLEASYRRGYQHAMNELASERPAALQQAREKLIEAFKAWPEGDDVDAAIDHLLLVQRQSCDAEILAALELQQAAHRDNLALVRQSWEKE